MSNKEKQYEFVGRVVRSIYDSADFRVYALDVDTKKHPDVKKNRYDNVSISGEIPELTLGTQYEITATETESKYGVSYKILNIKRDEPKSEEDTKIFLEEILTSNQADVLYENYPDIVRRVKEDDLDDVDLSKLYGIGDKTFERIKKKIIENFCLVDLVTEFKGVLSLNIIKKIYDKYSSIDLLRKKLRSEPYTSLTRISGIGFKTADSIILELQKEGIFDFGYDVKTSPDRCLSCLLYLLQENENEGNTKMNLADLRKSCLQLVPACADHFTEVIKSKSIYYNKDTMDVALRWTYETERYIARTMVENLNNCNNVWDYDIEKYRKVGEFELTDEQMTAVSNVCKHSISILNGAAGTGKSASTQAIISMLEDNLKSYKLFSPTGKAAKVLADYTKKSASTIHRGLGHQPPNIWTFNEGNKLVCDIVIVDEFSMVDVQLFSRLIEAIDFDHTKLLIIGDNAQLPSVSCGNLLHDFMQTNLIPTVTLTKVHRYCEGGLMKVATDTRCCKTYLNNSMKAKATTFGDNKDYMFVDLASEAIPHNAVALYRKLIDSGASIENIQVLTAKNVSDCGTVVLNGLLQKVANPNYGSKTCMKVGETTYYKGDLVIQCVNNYKAEIDTDHMASDISGYYCDDIPTAFVANGETGIIREIYNTFVIIDFDGVYVKYYRDNMTMVKLGYAITIHKSQGSSVDNVILCTPQSHIFMLNSNLLYVGLTRMRKKCYHLGSLNSVNQAIHKKENLDRHTFMKNLLIELNNQQLSQQ